VIETRDLTRSFNRQVAVERLSIDVHPGEIFALLGPNGAGKTTTLRLIGGLILADSGTARVAGIPLTRRRMQEVREKVGFLTEAPGLWDRLDVRKILLVYARLYGVANPGRAVDRILQRFGLGDRSASPAAELSKGMKQRVALARSMLHDPPVLLLDEPTSGLDPQTARSVRDLILEQRDRGRAIIISTHNLDEAERVATRVGVLQGHLVAVDSPEALRRRLFGQRIRFRVADGARYGQVAMAAGAKDLEALPDGFSVAVDGSPSQVPALVRALVQAGAAIEAVVPEQVPLEDVYLRLIEDAARERRPEGASAPGATA
jgi:ABC-2 type transport system ATP-binding protein